MSEQLQIPETAFEILSDNEIAAIRAKLIESQGAIEKAGIDLKTMRNVIYTCRMKAHPMQDTPSGEAKAKKTKEPSTIKQTISGDKVNDFFG